MITGTDFWNLGSINHPVYHHQYKTVTVHQSSLTFQFITLCSWPSGNGRCKETWVWGACKESWRKQHWAQAGVAFLFIGTLAILLCSMDMLKRVFCSLVWYDVVITALSFPRTRVLQQLENYCCLLLTKVPRNDATKWCTGSDKCYELRGY